MENIEAIISLAIAAAGFLCTAITFIVRFVRGLKAKKEAEDELKICEFINPLLEVAEKLVNYTGMEKREFVLTKANQFAIENNIRFETKKVIDYIDKLVSMTKEVNRRLQ